MAEPQWLRRSDRIFITGFTGSGKSVLARAIFAAHPPPRIVIDPKDDTEATGGAYADRRQAVTFSDPARLPKADVLRFVPRDPYDAAAYDRLYRGLWNLPGVFVWVDEAGLVLPARGSAPPAARRFVTQGRARGLGHLALHQRPVEVDRAIFANIAHLITFHLPDPDDKARVAAAMGLAPAALEELLGQLPPYGFAWYAARARTVTICPPISRR